MENNLLAKDIIEFFRLKDVEWNVAISTRLNGDLKISGDDVELIFCEFSKKFNIDFSSMDINKYFLPEMLFEYWYYKWFRPEKLIRQPLTVGHMIEVVKRGYWFEPE